MFHLFALLKTSNARSKAFSISLKAYSVVKTVPMSLCDILGGEAGVFNAADHGLEESGGAVDIHALVPVDTVPFAVGGAVVIAADGIADIVDQAAQLAVAEPADDALHGRIVLGGKLEAEVAADLVPIAGDIRERDIILEGAAENVIQESQLFLAVVVAAHIAGMGIRLDRFELGLHLFHTLDLGVDAGHLDPDGLGLGMGLFNALSDHFINELIIGQPDQDQGKDDEDDLLGTGEITAQDFHGLVTSSAGLR